MTRLTIDSLGQQGDGVAHVNGEAVFVPYTLKGEVVEAELQEGGNRASVTQIVTPAPERAAPVCQHYGVCGGCALQHLEPSFYARHKLEALKTTLAQARIDTEFLPLWQAPLAARRRASFGFARKGEAFHLAFQERGSINPVALDVCPVMVPQITEVMSELAQFARFAHQHHKTRLVVSASLHGLDVALSQDVPMNEAMERKAVALAASYPFIARYSINGKIALQVRAPMQPMGLAEVNPPPGSFLQAVKGAEDEMAAFAVQHLQGSKVIADLFAGCGAFTFPLAKKAKVTAFESEALALEAIVDGKRRVSGLKAVEVQERDLFKEPLAGKRLREFDGLMIDPPRAGAKAQVEAILKYPAPKLVMASCNPASFARDARALIDGGYALKALKPIDQFLYSPHMELIAAFERV